MGAELHGLWMILSYIWYPWRIIGESIILSLFIVSDYFSSLPYPSMLPPVQPPVQNQDPPGAAPSTPPAAPALADLQSQLHETQTSLTSHATRYVHSKALSPSTTLSSRKLDCWYSSLRRQPITTRAITRKRSWCGRQRCKEYQDNCPAWVGEIRRGRWCPDRESGTAVGGGRGAQSLVDPGPLSLELGHDPSIGWQVSTVEFTSIALHHQRALQEAHDIAEQARIGSRALELVPITANHCKEHHFHSQIPSHISQEPGWSRSHAAASPYWRAWIYRASPIRAAYPGARRLEKSVEGRWSSMGEEWAMEREQLASARNLVMMSRYNAIT